MFQKTLLSMGVALCCAQTPTVLAADATGLDALRAEVAAMRGDYEQRIARLEQRLAEAESAANAARRDAAAARKVAHQADDSASAAVAQADQAKRQADDAQDSVESVADSIEDADTAPTGGMAAAVNAFNPAISAVLQGRVSTYGNNPDDWHLQGFQSGGESGPDPRGLSLGETELTFAANVDDWIYGQATLSVKDDGNSTDVGFEEAYGETLSLPYGLGLRFGRFYSDIAFQNPIHSHAWDFADSPLAYQAFLGGQYSDDGLRLNWLAPTDLLLEFGVEALRGDNYPGGNASNSNKLYGGSHSAYVHLGGDIGSDHSWKLGLAQLYVQPQDRQSGHLQADGTDLSFDGDSRLTTASLLYKCAPNGNPQERNFTFEAEYFHRKESGTQTFAQNGSTALIDYRGPQQGFYLQGVYQFLPQWRAGLRYDRLWSDNNLRVSDNPDGLNSAQVLADSGLEDGSDPYRITAMVDFHHSEFGRFRLQYENYHSTPHSDNLVMLQYILAIGSHGAHDY